VAGLRFQETLRGGFHFLDHPVDELPMDLSVEIRVEGLRRFAKERTGSVRGHLTIEGFTDGPFEGTVGLAVVAQRRLPYDFSFVAGDGKTYRFRGEKDFTVFDMAEPVTLLPMSLHDEARREVGRATVRFDVRSDLKKALRSLRPIWR
jgi:hypothetical protein